MICPECNMRVAKISEEGAYCISCGYVFYGKLKGKNGLEIENERIQGIKDYLKNKSTPVDIYTLSNDLKIPTSIVEVLIKEMGEKGIFFLNLK